MGGKLNGNGTAVGAIVAILLAAMVTLHGLQARDRQGDNGDLRADLRAGQLAIKEDLTALRTEVRADLHDLRLCADENKARSLGNEKDISAMTGSLTRIEAALNALTKAGGGGG